MYSNESDSSARLAVGHRAAGRWRLQRARDSHGQDEVAQLAGGLNAMGQAIAQREEAMLQLIYRDELTGLGANGWRWTRR